MINDPFVLIREFVNSIDKTILGIFLGFLLSEVKGFVQYLRQRSRTTKMLRIEIAKNLDTLKALWGKLSEKQTSLENITFKVNELDTKSLEEIKLQLHAALANELASMVLSKWQVSIWEAQIPSIFDALKQNELNLPPDSLTKKG